MKAVKRVTEEDAQTFIYMTCCYVIIHQDNRLEFANAGHPAMLLLRTNSEEFIEFESQFTPVGIALPGQKSVIHYHSTETTWAPGDMLVLYSDGITETFNAAAEMYGLERFKKLLYEKRHLSPIEIKEAILSDLEAYQQGESLHDDITLVITKFL